MHSKESGVDVWRAFEDGKVELINVARRHEEQVVADGGMCARGNLKTDFRPSPTSHVSVRLWIAYPRDVAFMRGLMDELNFGRDPFRSVFT
ncbi:MAG: hypothetical protein AAGH89_06915, partial [Verrucomicrobiota bacterium]